MTASAGGRSTPKTRPLTGTLLLCGAIAGPLFLLTVLIQDYTVPGFDPRLDELSLLSLGDWGWVQIGNVVLAGVRNLLHDFVGLFLFAMLAAALGVFVRFFLERKERWWAFYCLSSAVLLILFFFGGGFPGAALPAGFLRLGTLVGWMAASLIAIKLLCTPERRLTTEGKQREERAEVPSQIEQDTVKSQFTHKSSMNFIPSS